jgi:hypothetical protein
MLHEIAREKTNFAYNFLQIVSRKSWKYVVKFNKEYYLTNNLLVCNFK